MESIKLEYIPRKKEEIKKTIAELRPSIAIIQVGHVPASDTYVKNKIKDCVEVGMPCKLVSLPETITEAELLTEIEKLNKDESVDGFIVQLPLPKEISEAKVKLAVAKEKDIDGFNVLNDVVAAATPSGIVTYLEDQGFDFDGKNAVILGRSNIVGKPAHQLLLKRNMNVIMLHTHTSAKDKKFYLEHADLVIVATGHRHSLTAAYNLKPDVVIMDVGINVKEDGKVCGDCDYEDLVDKVAFISKVPGGCGLLTRLQLINNTITLKKCYKKDKRPNF